MSNANPNNQVFLSEVYQPYSNNMSLVRRPPSATEPASRAYDNLLWCSTFIINANNVYTSLYNTFREKFLLHVKALNHAEQTLSFAWLRAQRETLEAWGKVQERLQEHKDQLMFAYWSSLEPSQGHENPNRHLLEPSYTINLLESVPRLLIQRYYDVEKAAVHMSSCLSVGQLASLTNVPGRCWWRGSPLIATHHAELSTEEEAYEITSLAASRSLGMGKSRNDPTFWEVAYQDNFESNTLANNWMPSDVRKV